MKDDLKHLKMLFAFGVPGGHTKIQKKIGRYLDGFEGSLDNTPMIKGRIDVAIKVIKADPWTDT